MQKSSVDKVLLRLVLLILIGIGAVVLKPNHSNLGTDPKTSDLSRDLTDLDTIKQAFQRQKSNFQITQKGKIVKLLRDDNHSPKHQRFIVQLGSGQKLLIAHNIELAPKVEGLKEGTQIMFFGEYEWNDKGGVVHWTHHAPKGQHPSGWLLYNNRKYQ